MSNNTRRGEGDTDEGRFGDLSPVNFTNRPNSDRERVLTWTNPPQKRWRSCRVVAVATVAAEQLAELPQLVELAFFGVWTAAGTGRGPEPFGAHPSVRLCDRPNTDE